MSVAQKTISLKNLLGKSATIPIEASLDGLTQRVLQERQYDEMRAAIAAPQSNGSSTTMIMSGGGGDQPLKKKRGGAKNDSWDDVVAPSIAVANARLPGNKLKSANAADPALVMRALYDDARAMTAVLCCFEKFTPYLHLIFTEDGLTMQVLHSTKTVSVELTVPRASFYRYDNLLDGTAVCVVVSANAMRNIGGSVAESTQTVSFLYHQCGRDDEPLHVQLNPRDGNSATAISVFYHLPHCEDEDTVQSIPARQMQYEICMDAGQFLSSVRKLAKTTSTIVLMLRQTADNELAFEMGGVGDSFDTVSLSHTHADPTMRTEAQCSIRCLQPNEPASRLDYFLNHRLLPQLLEAVASFGSLPVAGEVIIGLGIKLGETQGYTEEPVHITFPMRSQSRAPFTIDAWVCTELDKT